MKMQTRTVQVGHISDLAGEREIREFFSFSGDIEHIEIQKGSGVGGSKTAFVTFKEPRALEIALLLSGATIIDQTVTITRAENFIPKVEEPLEAKAREQNVIVSPVDDFAPYVQEPLEAEAREQTVTVSPVDDFAPYVQPKDSSLPSNGSVYVNKAQTVVTGMLAKGSAIGQEAMNKARAFDEKHRLTANASAKVISFDRRIGLTEKITVGISVVNEKVKSVDQRLHVSDKTMAALTVAERKLNDTGSAVKTNRYISAGTAWLNGAFGKVAKAGHVAGAKTREKFQLAVSNLTAKDPIATM